MNSFDQRAQTWDDNPMHLERSIAIVEIMKREISLHKKMDAMEYGAGTGILSFLLKDEVQHITMMDNSRKMVNVMIEKVQKMETKNLHPMFFDLDTSTYSAKTFDLIFMQMVLHFIVEEKALLTKCHNLLSINGSIAIADIYKEDGSFHGKDFIGHMGFDIDELSETMTEIGFKNIRHDQCFVVKKVIESGETKEFPIFLLIAEK